MKKLSAFRLSIIICVFIAMAMTFVFVACGTTKTFNLANITKVELTDGSNGNSVDIIEQNQIQALIQPFNDNEFTKGESSNNHTGWSYRLRFFQDDKMTTELVIMSSGRIDFNGSFYDIKSGTLDIEDYSQLFD